MPASKRCIFLAGAPEAEDLNWDEKTLLQSFRTPIKRYLGGETETVVGEEATTQATPPSSYAKWRSVSCDQDRTRTDGRGYPPQKTTQFLSFDNEEEIRSQEDFLEQSMAILDDMEPADIIPGATLQDANSDETSKLDTTFLSNASFTTTSFSTSSVSILPPPSNPAILNQIAPITDLQRIPNADTLARLQPQTLTVNLLVGIIAVSPLRTVRLRRRNAEMDILELTVGDDTRAGFGISFWLVLVERQRRPADDLREALMRLRTGDVVGLRNVALAAFRGGVFGQSLSWRFARNSTAVSLVKGDAGGGSVLVRDKVERVREWTRDFVGVARSERLRARTTTSTMALPPDTQD